MRFARAGLAGIEQNGSAGDAQWARVYLKDFLTKELAIRILGRLGNERLTPTPIFSEKSRRALRFRFTPGSRLISWPGRTDTGSDSTMPIHRAPGGYPNGRFRNTARPATRHWDQLRDARFASLLKDWWRL